MLSSELNSDSLSKVFFFFLSFFISFLSPPFPLFAFLSNLIIKALDGAGTTDIHAEGKSGLHRVTGPNRVMEMFIEG